ncbi:sufE-like protein 1, chloroplastic/mitochondrial [Macadamia integrifolia]|uniref:sufE-like protein 1, chloroplastic/mitochondrial n=1 Tax=Macadamia integrifolia TaxID=60698 RepID=UPI001C4F7051|nr:sufE-like protein 1, chloroplastic/mitochondrial [Macadamia integrifolia]XP_042505788.1 sufE-like protein 1, chloroplastic/mitochondrial [Macadamia integrifolia]
MAVSSPSFRLFAPRIQQFLKSQIPTSKSLTTSVTIPSRLFFFSSISIERLPTRLPSSSSSSSVTSASLQPVEELPPKLQEIVKLFQSVKEPKAKYEQLLFYGRNLSPLDPKFKTSENKVQGCVSQVWVRAYLDPDRIVYFEADSDSVLTKGLAALLVQGLSGRPVSEILKVSPDFVKLLGLRQSLTPSRNNGFVNMLNLMQKKALQVFMEAEEGASRRDQSGSLNSDSKLDGNLNSDLGFEKQKSDPSSIAEIESTSISSSSSTILGSRGERIKQRLGEVLNPVELEIQDISYQHAGHAGVRGSAGETHFNLKVVSKEFEGKSMVKRHRLIYNLLQEELQNGLHALSIVAKTPSEN